MTSCDILAYNPSLGASREANDPVNKRYVGRLLKREICRQHEEAHMNNRGKTDSLVRTTYYYSWAFPQFPTVIANRSAFRSDERAIQYVCHQQQRLPCPNQPYLDFSLPFYGTLCNYVVSPRARWQQYQKQMFVRFLIIPPFLIN